MSMLLHYSDNFALALFLWPFASLVLTLPILAFLYHRDGRLRFWSAVGCYIAVFYLLGLACFTFYPLPTGVSGLGITYGTKPQLDFWRFVTDIRSGGAKAIFQLAANVVLFVPLGFAISRGFSWGPVRTVLAGFGTSLLVETTQLTGIWGIYEYAYRTFDVDDLLTNTLGTLIGWAIAAAFARLVPHRVEAEALEPTSSPKFVRRLVAFVLDVSLAWMLAIVFTVFAQYVIRHHVLGLDQFSAAIETASRWSLRVILVIFEFVVPLCWGGKTLAGAFVRMTCETKPRRGLLRLFFFALRLATFFLVALRPLIVGPVLLVFWLIFRQMPYDLLPASAEPPSRAMEEPA